MLGSTAHARGDVYSRPPVIAAWGAGVDSTAMIIEMHARGKAPDMVLIASMPEKPQTLAFIPIFRKWMDDRGIPNEVVAYQPAKFKHWPPYSSLLENCLTNGTLPSISFGRSSCSQKWKIAPQDHWTKQWGPAQAAWARGEKVVRVIGYDASPRDSARYAHRAGHASDLFEYRYPLREWNWLREDCVRRIAAEGLPFVHKSSCFFCAGMTPEELRGLDEDQLRVIVLMEARAKPRLRTVEGLWRSSTKGLRGREARPGAMTDMIRIERLLDPAEIDSIIEHVPTDLVAFQHGAAQIPIDDRPPMATWLEQFLAGRRCGAHPSSPVTP